MGLCYPMSEPSDAEISTCYTLDMYDASSDGWEDAMWTWTSVSSGATETGTLAGGSSGTAALCGTGCYTFTVGDGLYPAEISWTITEDSSGVVKATGAQGSATSNLTEVCMGPAFRSAHCNP